MLSSVIKDFRSSPFVDVNYVKRHEVASDYDIEVRFTHRVGDKKCHCQVSLITKHDNVTVKKAEKDYPISSPDEAHSWIKYTIDNFTITAQT